MGYTHYWYRPKKLPTRKFAGACEDCRAVVAALKTPLRHKWLDDKYEYLPPPQFGPGVVQFNGDGDDAHDDFFIPKNMVTGEGRKSWHGLHGDFCKTARKPYDAAVCACLIVFHKKFGDNFVVSSNGTDDEEGWPKAREACLRTLGYGGDFRILHAGGERFGRRGLGYEPNGSVPQTWRLENGWEMYKRGWRVLDPDEITVVDRDHNAVIYARNLTQAAWKATCESVRRILFEKNIPEKTSDPFVKAAAEQPHDWAPLRVLADKLEDEGYGDDLRAYLPVRVAKGDREAKP